jgi:predicted dehydrogenase
MAVAGARARKHMLLEKPMCLNVQQAVEVGEAVEQARVKVMIDTWFRITPAAQKTKDLLAHPRLSHGQLAMGESCVGRSAWVRHPDAGVGRC